MDSSKVPVKLVKVTRVLGRTGEPPLFASNPPQFLALLCLARSIIASRLCPLLIPADFFWCEPTSRLSRRCDPSPGRIHGRHNAEHHPECQGTWYAYLSPCFFSSLARTFIGIWGEILGLIRLSCVVREDDILCLLESEREARRLR